MTTQTGYHAQEIKPAESQERAEIWLKENLEAIESSNAYVEKHGLPLAQYNQRL